MISDGSIYNEHRLLMPPIGKAGFVLIKGRRSAWQLCPWPNYPPQPYDSAKLKEDYQKTIERLKKENPEPVRQV